MMEGIGVKKSKPAFKEGLTDCCLSTHSQNDLMHANGTVSPSLSLFSFFFLPSPLPLRFPFIHVNIPPSPRPPPPSSLAACSLTRSLCLSPFHFSRLSSRRFLCRRSRSGIDSNSSRRRHTHITRSALTLLPPSFSLSVAGLDVPRECGKKEERNEMEEGRKAARGNLSFSLSLPLFSRLCSFSSFEASEGRRR